MKKASQYVYFWEHFINASVDAEFKVTNDLLQIERYLHLNQLLQHQVKENLQRKRGMRYLSMNIQFAGYAKISLIIGIMYGIICEDEDQEKI